MTASSTAALPMGRQSSGDDAFTARMRLHQSWYRANVVGVECGVGPNPHSQSRYGNMLSAEDGDRGLNFLTPEIAAYARARQKELPAGIKAHRLFCNMLSSQPMCFNLFAPLALDADLAAPLTSALLGIDVARVDTVIIEHAPAPKADYLDDNTSFDAYVEYRSPDGARGFVGIETKLTEPFSQDEYPISKRSYSRWVEREGSPWLASSRAMLDARGHNQLWRNHMLGYANAARATEPYAGWSVAVVRHPLDHKCVGAVETYAACLRPGETTLIDRPLDMIAERWRPIVHGTRWEPWWREFERRYLDLSESDAAFASLEPTVSK
jgi:hypothetical protein